MSEATPIDIAGEEWRFMVCPLCGVEAVVRKALALSRVETGLPIFCPNGHTSTVKATEAP